MFRPAEWLTVRTPQGLHQTSGSFSLTAPCIRSRGGFISDRHKHLQQKTGAAQNVKDHEKCSLTKTSLCRSYRFISFQGWLQNNSAEGRKGFSNGSHHRKSQRGERKLANIAGNEYRARSYESFAGSGLTTLLIAQHDTQLEYFMSGYVHGVLISKLKHQDHHSTRMIASPPYPKWLQHIFELIDFGSWQTLENNFVLISATSQTPRRFWAQKVPLLFRLVSPDSASDIELSYTQKMDCRNLLDSIDETFTCVCL